MESVHFGYSPRQVLEASLDDDVPDDLRELVALRDQFACAARHSPASPLRRLAYDLPAGQPKRYSRLPIESRPETRRWHCEWALFGPCSSPLTYAHSLFCSGCCDLSRLPYGWAITHAWCPLVVKEIANSGHLDSSATFLSVRRDLFGVAMRSTCCWKPQKRATLLGSLVAAIASRSRSRRKALPGYLAAGPVRHVLSPIRVADCGRTDRGRRRAILCLSLAHDAEGRSGANQTRFDPSGG